MSRTALTALLADAAVVLLFAAVGRSSHDESLSPAGVLETAWPFLAGAGLGWLAVRAARGRWPLAVSDGVVVWVAAVGCAMLLRTVTGAGTDPAFVVVAAAVVGVLLLGWRALRRRWRPTSGPPLSGRPDEAPDRWIRPR